METVIENLGRLAAKCDLDAAKPNLSDWQRSHLLHLARRYRDAQALELFNDQPLRRFQGWVRP
jgi:hypothetical protein